MIVVCCDTSLLYALYGDDSHTPAAKRTLARIEAPLTLSKLNEFELTNALLHSQWRHLIPSECVEQRLEAFRRDHEAGLLVAKNVNLGAVIDRALHLASMHTAAEGHRSFDVLHVAAALVLEADIFLTFDDRQRALAAAEGLRTEI